MEENTIILELQQKNKALQEEVEKHKADLKSYVESRKYTPDEWYRFWRTALKDQATVTTSIFFLFTGANLGYLVNSHTNKTVVDGHTKLDYIPFSINDRNALNFFVLSACCYGLLALSRYFDYRLKTVKYKKGGSFDNVIMETKTLFYASMFLLLGQILFFALGFFFQLRELYRLFY